jgi:hypothetical protein
MLNKTKLILFATGALLIIGGAFVAKGLYNDYMLVKDERDAYKGNQYAYVDIINNKTKEARVLRLSAEDLRHSNDSLINLIEKNRKGHSGATNKPGDISTGVATHIHDTTVVIINNPCNFKLDTVIKHNDLTKVGIKIEKDSLISTLDINNVECLYVYSHGEFVNQYKNSWLRFWHFDWKRQDVDRYDITNSNDLIKVDEVRVIKVRE